MCVFSSITKNNFSTLSNYIYTLITLFVNKKNCAENITSNVYNNCQVKYWKMYIALIILYCLADGQLDRYKRRWK
jgi:hypothetical protein